MNLEQVSLLARDSRAVHDSIAALMWWARGVVNGASSERQRESAERALSIAESAERTAAVVSHGLDAMCDEATVAEMDPEVG